MVADDVDGSASGERWIGLKQDKGEIIGEADANLLLHVVLLGATGDDGVPRKVAAAAMVCGRRLVFLVTHILFCGSSRTSIGTCIAKGKTRLGCFGLVANNTRSWPPCSFGFVATTIRRSVFGRRSWRHAVLEK